MTAIGLTTFSNYSFVFEFHWFLFPWVQLTMRNIGSDNGIGTNDGLIYWHIDASLIDWVSSLWTHTHTVSLCCICEFPVDSYCLYIHSLRASYQMRGFAGCACAGNAGNFFPPPTSKEIVSERSRYALRPVRHARAVMHAGIDNSRWREKRSRHSRRMHNSNFTHLARSPWLLHWDWGNL